MPKIVDSNTVTWSESSNELSATVGGDVVVDSVVIDDGGTIGSASASSAIAIDSSGNVGIGASSPTAPLTFGKSVYGDPSSENFYRIKFQDVGGIANDVGIGQPDSESMAFNFGASLRYIAFRAGTSGERMRITSSGNVGIGTSSPAKILTVNNLQFDPSTEDTQKSIRIISAQKTSVADATAISLFSLSKGAAPSSAGHAEFVGVIRVSGFERVGGTPNQYVQYAYVANVFIHQRVTGNITISVFDDTLTKVASSAAVIDVDSVTISLSSATATAASLDVTVDFSGTGVATKDFTKLTVELDGFNIANTAAELFSFARA